MNYELDGRVIGVARNVKTKYGLRGVLNVLTRDGRRATIWRDADDLKIFRLCDGERVTLTMDANDKPIDITGSYDRAQKQRIMNNLINSPVVATTTETCGFQINLPGEPIEGYQAASKKNGIESPAINVEAIRIESAAGAQSVSRNRPIGFATDFGENQNFTDGKNSENAQMAELADRYAAVYSLCLDRAQRIAPTDTEQVALEIFREIVKNLKH